MKYLQHFIFIYTQFYTQFCFILFSQIINKDIPNLNQTSPSGSKRLRHKAASLFIPFPFAICFLGKKLPNIAHYNILGVRVDDKKSPI